MNCNFISTKIKLHYNGCIIPMAFCSSGSQQHVCANMLHILFYNDATILNKEYQSAWKFYVQKINF